MPVKEHLNGGREKIVSGGKFISCCSLLEVLLNKKLQSSGLKFVKTKDIRKYVSSRRDMTELMLKAA